MPPFPSIEDTDQVGGPHGSLCHKDTWRGQGLPFLVLTNQDQDTTKGSPEVSCCSLRTYGYLSVLLLSVSSQGLKHSEKEEEGQKTERELGVGG